MVGRGMSYPGGRVSGVNAVTTPDVAPRAANWVPGYLALGAIWGSSFLFIKVGVAQLHPMYVALGRISLGMITLLVVLAVRRDRLPRDPRLWGHLVVIGTVGVAAPFTLFGYGEERIPSLLAGIWNATTPLVVLPLAILVFRTERFTPRRAAGMGIGFLGVLVVLGVWRSAGGAEVAGQLMCFAAAACYGLAIPYQKRFVAGRPDTGLAISAAQLVVATALLAVVAPLVAGAPPAPTQLSLDVIGSVLALGMLGTGLAFVIHLRNVRLVGASVAATVAYLLPVFAIIAGVVVLREPLAWHQPVGGLIVLAGVILAQGSPVRLPRAARSWVSPRAGGRVSARPTADEVDAGVPPPGPVPRPLPATLPARGE